MKTEAERALAVYLQAIVVARVNVSTLLMFVYRDFSKLF